MSASPAIRTVGLVKRFRHQRGLLHLFSRRDRRETTAVDGVSLDIQGGEIVGLLGPNGAGKTTFVKLLATLLLPSAGEAYVCGYDVVREPYRVKPLIGLVTSEERSFFWRLTGRQNLEFFAALYGLQGRRTSRRIGELFELLALAEAGDVRFNEYSTGMRQKLAIARGLLNDPKILLMDEPTKGLDPVSAQALVSLIRTQVGGGSGLTIIITTHILHDVEQLCDRVAIMNKGRIVASGSIGELRFVLRPYDRYRLKLRGLRDRTLDKIEEVPGMVNCAKISQEEGVVEVEIDLKRESNALSETLQHILEDRCDILACTLEEERIEDLFTNLLRQVGDTPAYQGAALC